jgi:hypothetical protein
VKTRDTAVLVTGHGTHAGRDARKNPEVGGDKAAEMGNVGIHHIQKSSGSHLHGLTPPCYGSKRGKKTHTSKERLGH